MKITIYFDEYEWKSWKKFTAYESVLSDNSSLIDYMMEAVGYVITKIFSILTLPIALAESIKIQRRL